MKRISTGGLSSPGRALKDAVVMSVTVPGRMKAPPELPAPDCVRSGEAKAKVSGRVMTTSMSLTAERVGCRRKLSPAWKLPFLSVTVKPSIVMVRGSFSVTTPSPTSLLSDSRITENCVPGPSNFRT